jgi:hypothetical protein
VCKTCLAPTATEADVRLYDLHVAEARLTTLTVERRRQRVVAPVEKRIAEDLRYVLRRERERVLDLMGQTTLRYLGNVNEAQVEEVNALMRLLLQGVDVNQYQAVLEDGYRATMPGAMDATLRQVLDAAGIKYRVGPLGDLFLLSNGFKLVRFRGAENWIRDNSIVFSRRYAKEVSDRLNLKLRETLADGMAQFEDMYALKQRVKAAYATVIDSRVEMIARTETNRAYNAAFMETGSRLGVRQKYWISSGSPYADIDVCGENAARGNIALYEKFRDTKDREIDGPPAHPNCLCSLGLDVQDDYSVPQEFLEAA